MILGVAAPLPRKDGGCDPVICFVLSERRAELEKELGWHVEMETYSCPIMITLSRAVAGFAQLSIVARH